MVEIADKLKEKFTDDEVNRIIRYAEFKYDKDIVSKSKFYENILNTNINDYYKSDSELKELRERLESQESDEDVKSVLEDIIMKNDTFFANKILPTWELDKSFKSLLLEYKDLLEDMRSE